MIRRGVTGRVSGRPPRPQQPGRDVGPTHVGVVTRMGIVMGVETTVVLLFMGDDGEGDSFIAYR